MIRHARWCEPQECCGLVAMDGSGRIRMAYPLTNAQASPTRFTIEPREHFGALMHAERNGWQIGGVFHSHPLGEPVPSATDLAQPHDPGWVHLIVGLEPGPRIRAWWIRRGRPVEVPVG